MGILDGILNAMTGGIGKSMESGANGAREFEMLWHSIFGSYPPEAATRSMRNICITITTHTNNGNHSYGAQKIKEDMLVYGEAVDYNYDLLQFAVLDFLYPKLRVNGAIPRQFEWAREAIVNGYDACLMRM